MDSFLPSKPSQPKLITDVNEMKQLWSRLIITSDDLNNYIVSLLPYLTVWNWRIHPLKSPPPKPDNQITMMTSVTTKWRSNNRQWQVFAPGYLIGHRATNHFKCLYQFIEVGTVCFPGSIVPYSIPHCHPWPGHIFQGVL